MESPSQTARASGYRYIQSNTTMRVRYTEDGRAAESTVQWFGWLLRIVRERSFFARQDAFGKKEEDGFANTSMSVFESGNL